jgi:hypothetical protein
MATLHSSSSIGDLIIRALFATLNPRTLGIVLYVYFRRFRLLAANMRSPNPTKPTIKIPAGKSSWSLELLAIWVFTTRTEDTAVSVVFSNSVGAEDDDVLTAKDGLEN